MKDGDRVNDVIIIGGGPAGLSSAIYAARGGMDTVLFEKIFAGGQMLLTDKIENFPGIHSISGMELASEMENHAKTFGAAILNEEIVEIKLDAVNKIVKTKDNSYSAKAIILAMGASPVGLDIEAEQKFKGAGLSYCATCDGAFFRDRVVAVVGGGNAAVEDAIVLSRYCKKVYLIHRRDTLRAEKILQDALKNTNVEPVWNSVIVDILGNDSVESLILNNVKTNQQSTLPVDGLFVAIGTKPNSELVKGLVDLNPAGYIQTDEHLQTNIFGVYAAGDVRDKQIRQVVVAASDGAIAAQSAIKYINEHQWA